MGRCAQETRTVRAPYLLRTVECDTGRLKKQYVYNHEFTITKGKEFFVDGEITFPDEPLMRRFKGEIRADSSYDTRFGPCIEHTGVKYEESNKNVSIAMRRLTRARVDLETHTRLKRAQTIWFERHQEVLEKLRDWYSDGFCGYTNSLSEAHLHHADPHIKRALRIKGWQELTEGGDCGKDLWLRTVTYKMKKAEWGKPGKEPRMIGDLGVNASLQGFVVTDYIKKVMHDKPIRYRDGIIYFCKSPSYKSLKYVFDELIYPSTKFFFVYFSDDSCYSTHTEKGVFRCNVDISSCDGSHGVSTFNGFVRLFNGQIRDDVQKLVDQCSLPIRVYDLADDCRKRYVEMVPHEPKLYSGSTMTTAINGFANICIAIQLFEDAVSNSEALVKSAEKVGYIVTCELADDPVKLQFLKHSPVLDENGTWQPVLNLGVLLRLSGTCKHDLPGRGDWKTRGRAFQAGLLNGAYPRTHFPLIDNMKRSAGKSNSAVDAAVSKVLEYKVCQDDDAPVLRFSSAEVYRRYELTHDEQIIMDSEFGNAGFGHFFTSTGASKILDLDYGLECL